MKFTWVGSVRVGLLLIALAAIGGIGYMISKSGIPIRYANRGDVDELLEHQVDNYKMLVRINEHLGQVHTDYQRVSHYISGHDFHHPTDFCPVCGLLSDLNKRKDDVNQRVINLSEEQEELKQSGLKDSKEYKDKTDEANRLMVEMGLLNRYLFNEEERAIEVNRLMRKQRVVGGQFNPDPRGN